jgi:precorrin-4/cobalt-precorrin-4 C11-methyltransferase
MTVHFVGAGPGAADLITLRGRDLLARCPICVYAGSTVSPALLDHCAPGARLIDSAPLSLDEIETILVEADREGHDVVRLHSGDLATYSAFDEQAARLRARGIAFTMTPGVPALGGAAASIGRELTRPGHAQSVVITRLSGRATPVPEGEQLETFAATGALLAIHLSVHRLAEITARLSPVLGNDCPVSVIERATWPDERLWEGTLASIEHSIGADAPPRMALVLVGRMLGDTQTRESALYDPAYRRRFRSP